MSDYPYLRAHSYYSFLEALLLPGHLVAMAVEQGIHTLGLTDHRYLTGAIEFYEACKKAGIKPILGLEIDLSIRGYQGKSVLIAKNQDGWSNLCRLSSAMLANDQPIPFDTFIQHNAGLLHVGGAPDGILRELMLSSPGAQNLPGQFLEMVKEAFQEDCYIEIQRFANTPLKNESALLELASKHAIPVIASQDIYYRSPSDQSRYRTITAIKHNTAIQAIPRSLLPVGNAYFPSAQDFSYRFKDLPQALSNLMGLADRCSFELPIGQMHYPQFPTPNEETQAEFLRRRAYDGAKAIYGTLTSEISDRLDYELSVISGMGYEPIFLIVEDVLNHARQLGIPTSSRGSAASSLVAHCLSITSPDPLALNLYFERFLNPARKKPPDIDTDIASHRRDEVIQYVFDTYGEDRVAMVGTITRYRPKSALGDVAKAYGLSPEAIRALSKKLPSSFRF